MSTEEIVVEMTGQVWKMFVDVDSQVQVGDTVAIIESMKMEFPIEASVAGRVSELFAKEGDNVSAGAIIARISATDF